MRIYIAARYDRREQMQGLLRAIEEIGHRVTSRWIRDSFAGVPDEICAGVDESDIDEAEALVAFSEPRGHLSHGGRHVEFGIALALNKRLFLVGDRENVFHHHPSVEQFKDVNHLLAFLRENR